MGFYTIRYNLNFAGIFCNTMLHSLFKCHDLRFTPAHSQSMSYLDTWIQDMVGLDLFFKSLYILFFKSAVYSFGSPERTRETMLHSVHVHIASNLFVYDRHFIACVEISWLSK